MFFHVNRHISVNSTIRILCLICVMLTCGLSVSNIYAGADQTILVENIEPELYDGHLTVSATFKNLFSRKTTSTIQSGLPSLIQIDFKIIEIGHKNVIRKNFIQSITYNIWDEQYIIQSEDTTLTLNEFSSVIDYCTHLDHKILTKQSTIKTTSQYLIEMRIEIIPISAQQGEKIQNWIRKSDQTSPLLKSDQSSSTLELNVGKLGIHVCW